MKNKLIIFLIALLFSGILACRRTGRNADETLPYKIVHHEAIRSDSMSFRIDIKYPFFVPLDSSKTSLKTLNRAIQQFLDTAMMTYWGADTTETAKIVNETGAEGHFILMNNYYLSDTSSKIISLVFETYSYALGAHGFTAITTFNYDLINQKMLKLTDLIDLSPPVKQQVLDSLLMAHFENPEGCFTTPPFVDKSFERYALEPDTMVFYYEAYELGAYSCGSAKVKIPLLEMEAADLLLQLQ